MTKTDASDDLIRYVRENADVLTWGAAYVVDIAKLAEQIKDEPENRAKLTGELGRKRALLAAHAAAVQGVLERTGPERADADRAA